MTQTVETRILLTALDRCDKCSAAAMVRATFSTGKLHFCGHHGREAGSNLMVKALEVYDPEGVLNYGK